jgi:hypothetical protein
VLHAPVSVADTTLPPVLASWTYAVVYLPMHTYLQFWTAESSQKYAKAKDYPDVARAAIKEMHRQVSHNQYHQHASSYGCMSATHQQVV